MTSAQQRNLKRILCVAEVMIMMYMLLSWIGRVSCLLSCLTDEVSFSALIWRLVEEARIDLEKSKSP